MKNNSNIQLSIKTTGHGSPVVFIHGFLEDSTMWNGVSTDNICAIKVDLPGHGDSPEANSQYSIVELAMKIHEHLSEDENYTIIGHSMGGYVGLELMRLGKNYTKLILLNSNFWADDEEKKFNRRRVAELVQTRKRHFIYEAIPNLFNLPEKFDKQIKCLIKDALLISKDSIAQASIAMANRRDNTDLVEANKVVVMQGEFDAIVPIQKMKKAQKALGFRLIEFDSGHMSHIESLNELNKELKELFISSHCR
jgi:pimeloyl-ACP methyl ester carboxylesterase